MSRHAEAEALWGHPLQYAIVNGLQYPADPVVVDTENLDDEAVLYKLRMGGNVSARMRELTPQSMWMLDHLAGYQSQIRLERYNRCPTCEQWSPCDVRRREKVS